MRSVPEKSFRLNENNFSILSSFYENCAVYVTTFKVLIQPASSEMTIS